MASGKTGSWFISKASGLSASQWKHHWSFAPACAGRVLDTDPNYAITDTDFLSRPTSCFLHWISQHRRGWYSLFPLKKVHAATPLHILLPHTASALLLPLHGKFKLMFGGIKQLVTSDSLQSLVFGQSQSMPLTSKLLAGPTGQLMKSAAIPLPLPSSPGRDLNRIMHIKGQARLNNFQSS